MNDLDYMREAFAEALKAYENGEYPVGAVVVNNGEILSQAANAENSENDPTAHAEIQAIRKACKKLRKLKLNDCTLYTTLYPCPMCERTIIEVGIKKVVYGGETFKWIRDIKYSKKELELTGPILNEECREIFAKRLKEKGRNDILNYENS
jgi:tRNA(adenine34) deaminase